MLIKFENVELNVVENKQHEWLLSTDLVAMGYGVSESNIRKHKMSKPEELKENKHFVTVTNSNGGDPQVFWTKRGVVRLGFFIKSKQAVAFRDFSEDLVIEKTEQIQKPLSHLEILQQSVGMLVEQEKRLNTVESKLHVLEARQQTRPDYFTIVGYGTLHHVSVNLKQAASLGRRASELCKQRGFNTDKIPDPRFGEVKMYPVEILDEVFEQSLTT